MGLSGRTLTWLLWSLRHHPRHSRRSEEGGREERREEGRVKSIFCPLLSPFEMQFCKPWYQPLNNLAPDVVAF